MLSMVTTALWSRPALRQYGSIRLRYASHGTLRSIIGRKILRRVGLYYLLLVLRVMDCGHCHGLLPLA